MTQEKEDARRVKEWKAAFMLLDDKGKDSALTILKALRFAQSVAETQPRRAAEPAAPKAE